MINSYLDAMQSLADRYCDESGKQEVTTQEIAAWAIRNKLWEPPKDLVLQKCREDFANALREQYIKDENGRPVRAKHSARIRRGSEQLCLWADIRNASTKHMERAFSQRRQQIVGDCQQLKRDADYYNSLHEKDSPIQLVFDFTEDIEEGEFSGAFKSGA